MSSDQDPAGGGVFGPTGRSCSTSARGWRRLYATSVNQAAQGADLDFLR